MESTDDTPEGIGWDYLCDESAGIWTYPANHMNSYPNDFTMDHHNDSVNEQWYNGAWYPAAW